MTQFASAFGQIPLEMTAEPGAVIEDPQQNRIYPLAVGPQHAQGAVMKIQMPESIDIFAFVAADLPGFVAPLGCSRSGTVDRPAARTLEQPVTFHVTQEGDVGRHGTGLGLLFRHHGQVVEMKLVTPTGVLPVLLGQQWNDPGME